MSVVFGSDSHLQHSKLLTFGSRKFATIEEHDNTVTSNFISMASKETTLWHNGDVSVGGDLTPETIERLRMIVAAFKRVHLVPGNHDTKPKIQKYRDIGIIVEAGMVEFKGDFCLTHPPVHPQQLGAEGYEGRFKANIHGHLHDHIITKQVYKGNTFDSEAVKHVPFYDEVPDPRYVNVSLEQINLTPAPFEVIKRNLREAGVF